MAMNEQTQVDHSACAASGCPMMATNSHGTNGESPWYCFIHFSAEPGNSMRISAELNRLRWLVDVVRALRVGAGLSFDQNQSFVLAQRSDLKRKESESTTAWMIRLEGVLQQSCRDSLVQP